MTKPSVEEMRNQQSQMKQILETVDTESYCYKKVKLTIKKIELACKQFEEDSFGFMRGGAMDDAGMPFSLQKSILDNLIAFTEG